ncbi:MAG: NAD(P)/FAD-dependent oxidoreductase [Dehalococcoidales bacterium]|nr:NAD(P)/FAD-dependent oxidoreductase [Dehalococcoidales bacterium]
MAENINHKTEYLIIGNSAGGIGAAEAIREVDKTGSITIVSDEQYPVYSRPLISKYLGKGYPLDKILYRPRNFYQSNNIEIMPGSRVTGIDFEGRTAELDNGKTVSWNKLLLAPGGKPIVPRMEGLDANGIFTFATLDDAMKIDGFLKRYSRPVKALIIGGGLIGVSAAEALTHRGIDITVVEMKERILNTILDVQASAMEAEALKKAGIEIITGNTVVRINATEMGDVSSVSLGDGRQIPCDIVIMAIGVQPRIELVAGSDIKTDRGIIVDRHMATSVDGVYACGDAAQAYDFIWEENRLTPVWPNAYLGGRVAGLNMAGATAEYPGGTALNAMNYFGMDVVSAGVTVPPDDTYDTVSARYNGTYKKVVTRDGIITGMVYIGDIEMSGIVYNLMKDRENVDSFKDVLVSDDFGIISLPEELRKKKLSVPVALAEEVITSIEQPEVDVTDE